MNTAFLVVSLVTAVACALSGIGAMARLKVILPAMAAAGVPESWLVFPIGVLKAAGALGVLAGLLWFPLLATIAAFGLVLYFTCALYTHIRAQDFSAQFALANGFFVLCLADLVLSLRV